MHRYGYPHSVAPRLLWRLAKSDRSAAEKESASNRRPEREKFHDPRSLRSRRLGANRLKIFIDRLPRRWLKVGLSGAKWTIAPLDQWTPIPHPNAFMPESSGILSMTRIESRFPLDGGAIVLRNSFFCRRRRINFCSSCRQRSLRR